jgi:hypothetical protein
MVIAYLITAVVITDAWWITQLPTDWMSATTHELSLVDIPDDALRFWLTDE